MTSHNKFSFSNKLTFSDEEIQSPTVLLWTIFYLAQHFDHLDRSKEALAYINEVLEHTPTLIEGYMVQAKIYKVCDIYLSILKIVHERWLECEYIKIMRIALF